MPLIDRGTTRPPLIPGLPDVEVSHSTSAAPRSAVRDFRKTGVDINFDLISDKGGESDVRHLPTGYASRR